MFEHLFQPITINGMILKNRIVATPTGDDFEEKAMGGAGLVMAGHCIVEPGRSSFASGAEPWPLRNMREKRLREKASEDSSGRRESIHRGIPRRPGRQNCRLCQRPVRLHPPGRRRGKRNGRGHDAGDPALVRRDSRRLSENQGFDSIFLHFGHGWLPAQFLSPHYNHRTDEYGGSIENRCRFPLRILETVRKAVGKNYPSIFVSAPTSGSRIPSALRTLCTS